MTRWARRCPRKDANQDAVKTALEMHGWFVLSLAYVGGPVDLLVADEWCCWVCEVKDGAKSPRARQLTDVEIRFLELWPGMAAVVLSPHDAIDAGEAARRGELEVGIRACRRYLELTGVK